MPEKLRHRIELVMAAIAAVAILALSGGALATHRARPAFNEPDWALSGVVVYTLEIPNSGGAWAVTIGRERPQIGGSIDYLLLICDHEQEVTVECAALPFGAPIWATGVVLSNEPHTGQRLSVRELARLPAKKRLDP